MKTILIVTDLSGASRVASLYGIQLGETLGAKIILFTEYSRNHTPTPNVRNSRLDAESDIGDMLEQEVLFLRDNSSLSIETVRRKGLPDLALKNILVEQKVDFIILGLEGAAQNFKKVFGSTVTEFSETTQTPVLVMPEQQ